MTATLELNDSSTTLDLRGATYNATRGELAMPPPPVNLALAGNSLSRQTFGPREISMGLTIYGTTVPLLEANIRTLENMLASAAERQFYGQSPVVLKTQVGNTNADDIEYRVLRGSYSLPTSILNETDVTANKASVRGILSLLVEPLGRLAQVTLTQVTLENEQDGNNNNYVDIEGAFGPYLSFNGSSDLVTITDAADIQDIFVGGGTVEAWVYAKSSGGGAFGRLFDKAGWRVWVSASDGSKVKITFWKLWSGTNGQWDSTSVEITLNQWVHIAITYNADAVGNNPIIYVDGVSVALTQSVGPPTGTQTTDVGDNLIFGNRAAADRAFDGFIDEIRAWSDTRTSTEITDNQDKELVGNEAGLVGYWPMNDSAGTVIRDHTATPLTSAITGATWTIGGRPLGTEAGRMQIKIADEGTVAWNGSKKMWIAKRTGARRADDLFIQGEAETSFTDGTTCFNAASTFSTNGALALPKASAGLAAQIGEGAGVSATAVVLQFTIVGSFNYDVTALPKGIFRVLVRVGIQETLPGGNPLTSEVGFALGYTYGALTKTPVTADMKTINAFGADTWEILDLGEIVIPPAPTPDGYTDATLQLQINTVTDFATAHTVSSGDDIQWYIDYIFLLPIDEGAVAVSGVAAADRILVDGLSEALGVYILNSSDVVQKAATKTGGPFDIGPEPTRIYVLRDDPLDPTTVKFNVDIQHTPQVIGI